MADNLIWIDLEMTGLEPEIDTILEIATIVTDSELNILAKGPAIAIHHPDTVLDTMNEWCVKQHGKSGLTQRCKESIITLKEAEAATITFLKEWVAKGVSPMCGNSVWQDRRFLAKYMKELEAYFHYRLIDVSTLKELAKRWEPSVVLDKGEGKHLAMDDIEGSIAELAHYRATFLK